jgi:carboxyl-terminal processing protease
MRLLAPLVLLLGALSVTRASAASIASRLSADDRRSLQREALLLVEFLQGYHYAERPFLELNVSEFLDRYATSLDPARMVFTAEDVAFIHSRFERNMMPVYLFKGDLHPAFEIFDLFAERLRTRAQWVQRRLATELDLQGTESFNPARQEAAWPVSPAAADRLWEQRLKSELVGLVLCGLTRAEAAVHLRRSFSREFARIDDFEPLAVRELFLNAMLGVFDPHSGYFSHESAEDFDREMSVTRVGLGLDMEVADGRVVFAEIDPGGPADVQGEIHPGDTLHSIAEEGGIPVAVARLKRARIQSLLAGPENSRVTLVVQPASGGEPKPVTLSRAKVSLVTQRARGAIVGVPGGKEPVRIGLLRVPAFYGPSNDGRDGAGVSADVAEILAGFAAADVQGVVLDLRDNPGGRLDEAVALTGLFIRQGPVAYVRGQGTKPVAMTDSNSSVAQSGPLVVLTSPGSASASELVAGALQHYHRAVIVGAEQTFGKGTAQDYIDLRQTKMASVHDREIWGTLRVTRQYFYFPSGRSPQREGVHSDIVLPGAVELDRHGEKRLPHALPTEAIQPTAQDEGAVEGLAIASKALLSRLRESTARRVETEPEFKFERHRLALLQASAAPREFSTNLAQCERNYAEKEAEISALTNEQRALQSVVSYSSTEIVLRLAAEHRARHQAALAQRLRLAHAAVNSFIGDTFYLGSGPDASIQELRTHRVGFYHLAGEVEPLAAAWRAGSGTAMDAETLTGILRTLAWRGREDYDTVAELFRQRSKAPLTPAALAAGLDAFFAKAISLDPDGADDSPRLDVPLRESLRLAAEWVQFRATSTRASLAPTTHE